MHLATSADVADLVCLRSAVQQQQGAAATLTGKGVLFTVRHASVFIVRSREHVIATLTLSTRKPWAIDKSCFASSLCPLYLTSMAVHPRHQRRGLGRHCLVEAQRVAREWPSGAIRLDAYDSAIGAGEFYRKCGFREVGRATYRNTPLIYFELLL